MRPVFPPLFPFISKILHKGADTMQQQMQAHLMAWMSHLRTEGRRYMEMIKTTRSWRAGVAHLAKVKDRPSVWFQSVAQRRLTLAILILLTVVIFSFLHTGSRAEMATDDDLVPEAQAVICIGVAHYRNGVQEAFFQRGGESVEATLIQQHGPEMVALGYTVEHQNCYGNWQAAADFLTDGQVRLPDDADEAIFSIELLKWKQQQIMGSQ